MLKSFIRKQTYLLVVIFKFFFAGENNRFMVKLKAIIISSYSAQRSGKSFKTSSLTSFSKIALTGDEPQILLIFVYPSHWLRVKRLKVRYRPLKGPFFQINRGAFLETGGRGRKNVERGIWIFGHQPEKIGLECDYWKKVVNGVKPPLTYLNLT